MGDNKIQANISRRHGAFAYMGFALCRGRLGQEGRFDVSLRCQLKELKARVASQAGLFGLGWVSGRPRG